MEIKSHKSNVKKKVENFDKYSKVAKHEQKSTS